MIRTGIFIIAASLLLQMDVFGQSIIKFEEVSEKAGVRFVHSTRKFGNRHKAQVLQMFTDGGAAVATT